MLNISFNSNAIYENETIVIYIDEDYKIDAATLEFDSKFSQLITSGAKNHNKFKGKFGETCAFTFIHSGSYKNLILIGTGKEAELKSFQIEQLGGKAVSIAKAKKFANVSILVSRAFGRYSEEEVMALLASGAMLNAYKFDKYFSTPSEEEKEDKEFIVESVAIVGQRFEAAESLFKDHKILAESVYFARDLVSEAPNVLYPETYAELIATELETLGVDVEVLGEREMRSLGMGALLGVGQGSARESKIVIMSYKGLKDDSKPLALVGKGVTFDTGGISLKPSAKMDAMKYDMAGSAAVVGAIKALAARKAKVNVVGIVGLVENMPDGNAQRPGDVVRTMSGKTVEVLNTDAEGRLVLADCITYIQQHYSPEYIIDLATLTGAIIVALASSYAGLFCNDEDFAKKLLTSSENIDEKLWRMPLHSDYDKMLKSPIADIANISHHERGAGSSTAAHFIKRFVNKDVKWAHLDIAGMAWENNGTAICPKGAVGFGVRLLNQFILDHYETK
ncbi:MAG: leucyl aminopeptidase [Rickettsiaceae bacterium]|nr:leucyl aminopeptidase [Rickettsiaceae bacterium]